MLHFKGAEKGSEEREKEMNEKNGGPESKPRDGISARAANGNGSDLLTQRLTSISF